ncbi:tetratricopeptide repeat protein [candidate division KSB1 bacterium]|nr:tetratricopeptide repeat protein [candidate division KSB1 bacterium]
MRFFNLFLIIIFITLFLKFSIYGQNSSSPNYFLEDENYQASKSQLIKLYNVNKTDHQTAYYLGRIAMIEKAYDQAVEYFQHASELQPQNSKYHFWLGRAYGVQAMKANIFKKAILAGRVKAEMEKAVELDPENIEARKNLFQFYAMAPGVMGGSDKKALAQADEIKKRNEVEGILALGQIYLMKKNYLEAEKAFLYGLQKNNQNEQLYSMLAFTYQRQNQIPKAFETLEKLIAQRPDYINGYAQMGLLAGSTGKQLERGIICLNKYLSLYAKNPEEGQYSQAWTYYRLGIIYEEQGKEEMAKESYRIALQKEADYKPANKALERINKKRP